VYILGNFILALAKVLDVVLMIYMWCIIINALLSWVNPDPYNPIVQFLNSITEPVLYRVRQLIPISGVGIDFSPILVILVIYFLQIFLVRSLQQIGMQLQ
jgi:YggT family protein